MKKTTKMKIFLRRTILFSKYRFYELFKIDRLVKLKACDRQLGITTFLIKEAYRTKSPIICKDLRSRNYLLYYIDKNSYSDIPVYTVNDIKESRLRGVYDFHTTNFLCDCVSKYDAKAMQNCVYGIKLKGFWREIINNV